MGGALPLARIERGTNEQDFSCGVCGYSQVLVNLSGDSQVEVDLVATRHHVLNKPEWDYTRHSTVKLSPSQKYFLGCTGASEVGSSSCNISFGWSIEGYRKMAGVSGRSDVARLASTAPLMVASAVMNAQRVVSQVPAGNCLDYCKKRSPYCITFASRDAIVNDGIASVAGMFKRNLQTIEMQSVLQSFGLKEDPCARQAISIGADSVLRNKGLECELRTSIGDPSQGGAGVSVTVPENLSASIRSADSLATLTFENALDAPRLEIDNQDLNADWGGVITQLQWDGASAYLKTENGCIQLVSAGAHKPSATIADREK